MSKVINWNVFKNFKEKEFVCPCCKKQEMDQETVRKIQEARKKLGAPLIVNSGWRCKKYNEKIGGVPNSSHIKGHAVDLQCLDNKSRYLMISALLDVGFTRIIVYPTFIHADDAQPEVMLIIKPN